MIFLASGVTAMKTKCNSINVKLACWLATFHSSEAILFHVKTKVRQKWDRNVARYKSPPPPLPPLSSSHPSLSPRDWQTNRQTDRHAIQSWQMHFFSRFPKCPGKYCSWHDIGPRSLLLAPLNWNLRKSRPNILVPLFWRQYSDILFSEHKWSRR